MSTSDFLRNKPEYARMTAKWEQVQVGKPNTVVCTVQEELGKILNVAGTD